MKARRGAAASLTKAEREKWDPEFNVRGSHSYAIIGMNKREQVFRVCPYRIRMFSRAGGWGVRWRTMEKRRTQ